jgi:hypothetical protein
MELIILILLVCVFFPGGGGHSADPSEAIAMVLCFVVCVALVIGWFVAPLYAVMWLEETYGPSGHYLWICPVWYIGTISLNYFLAVRSEKRREAQQL